MEHRSLDVVTVEENGLYSRDGLKSRERRDAVTGIAG